MGSTDSSTPRRHLGAVVAVVLAVAAVLVGASALAHEDTEPAPTAAAPAPAPAPVATTDLDRGPVSDADVAACASGGFAADPSSVEVLYGVRQLSADGDVPVLLLRNAAGDLRFCDVAGPDAPAQLPLPAASAGEPVVFLTNGRKSWDCSDSGDGRDGPGSPVEGYTATTWLAVGPEVATVQERFWQDGEPGPWFSTAASGGYAHLQTWITGPVPATTRLGVQTRVLDADGRPVAQSALSRGRVPLAGCTDGDVQIG
jgi:hypothetical protein